MADASLTSKPEKLLPCPFCLATPVVGFSIGRRSDGKGCLQRVKCLDCGASGPEEDDADEAAAMWNRRLSSPVSGADGYVMVPREPTEAWVHSLANWRQGQRETPRCEPPGRFELDRARSDISAVLTNAPASPTPATLDNTAVEERCTDCDDTGITGQTERACSCAAGDAYRTAKTEKAK